MALAARKRMFIRQYDVKIAYLNGTLEEEIFMEVPRRMKFCVASSRMSHPTVKSSPKRKPC